MGLGEAGRKVRRAAWWVAAAVFLTTSASAAAEPPGPQLIARDYRDADGDRPRAQALQVDRLEIAVKATGALARTTATVRFANPTDAPLEGDFTMDLPAGSVVTGYALDVGGQMVDGVLAPKRQATLAYQARVRGDIDPGLAETTRTGAFRTRVFPIPPREGRTVRLSFVTPLDGDAPYVLPLALPGRVALSLAVEAEGVARRPALAGPEGVALGWSGSGARLTARATRTGPVVGALRIGPVSPAAPVLLSRTGGGERFFDLNDAADSRLSAASVRRLRVYWDRSRSRRDDDLAAEIALLERYVEAERPAVLDLILFADDGPQLRTLNAPDPRAVGTILRRLDYEGATSLQRVLDAAVPAADACVLVSDGTVTLDPYRAQAVGCPLFTVSSARDADRGFLGALARASGGEHIDLTRLGAQEGLARLRRRSPQVVGVRDGRGGSVDYAVLPAGSGRVRVVGRTPESGTLRVDFADGSRRTYDLGGVAVAADESAASLWAADAAARLAASDRPDPKALTALARRYSVATPSDVFIVLERAEDYAEAEIAPPASLGREVQAQWRALAADRAREKARARAERLDRVVEAWREQKAWWRTRFPAKPRRKAQPRGEDGLPPPPAVMEAPPAEAPPPLEARMAVESVVVTGSRVRRGVEPAVPAITVEVEPWNPSRPYLQVLRAVPPSGFRAAYLEQERLHGDLPAFYFDVAELLFRAGRPEEARRTALNALELPSADTATLHILADRMQRYGDDARAIWLLERILYLEGDRPQPRRNLALTLIARTERAGTPPDVQRSDRARALDLLSEVVLTPWSSAYDGIELIALNEANRLIPQVRAAGGEPTLDPRLVALMDLDLRVVLEWSVDATDMDLWVDEPTGERAVYSNPRTEIGGRLSNDMTQGYGPEEYMLRRAPDGRYTVRVNAYAGDRLNPNGAVTVRAYLFRDWGRADQAVQVAEIELKPEEGRSERLVGSLTVDRSRRSGAR